MEWTPIGMMRIASHEVNPIPVKQCFCERSRHFPKSSIEGSRCHLDKTSVPHEFRKTLRTLLKESIPLRMRHDQRVACVAQPLYRFTELRRYQQIRELDEEITLAVDRIPQRIRKGILDIVRVHMEVTGKAQANLPIEFRTQLLKPRLINLCLIRIGIVRMGTANQVRNALVNRSLSQFKGSLQVWCAVIDSVDQVCVDVDHKVRLSSPLI
jgi:hypothetical protein